ncbi:MAG: hypothetical protein OEM82_11965, partial [Acidobacteriota bacterium]|nr:hypothetical protein [Acidobacteriota bacterium]
DAQQEIDKLERLRREVARLDDYERDGPPLSYRFGFYSGSRIFRERLLYIYYVGVEKRFRQPTLARLQKELEAFSRTSLISAGTLTSEQEKVLDRHYDLLKAYLMLTTEYKDRSDASAITEALEDIWIKEAKLPAGNELKAKEQLRFYFKQIDRESTYEGDSSGFPRLSENKTLVKAVRNKLEAFPPYLRYLKLSIAEASKEHQPVTVDTLLQGRSQGVITGTHQVPGAFTIKGYREFMVQAFSEATTKMNKDDWVMGKKSEEAEASSDDLAKLREKYFNDYTDHWRKLVREAQVLKYNSQDDLSKALSAFSDTDSPMKELLKEIAANTDFSTKQVAKGWFDLSWISDWWSGASVDSGAEKQNVVETEFRPLFAFIGSGEDGDDKAAGISKYGTVIKDLNEELGNISASEKAAITNELIQEKGKRYRLIRRVENDVKDMLRGFDSPGAKEIAGLLNEPVISVRAYFGAGALDQLEKDWSQRILPKAREIETGYPFTADGEADLIKLSAYLNPQTGELSKFYKERLERYFEEVNGKLSVKETSAVKFSPAFVTYLNNAFTLRRTLFGENATPNFEYDFRLIPIPDALIEITIDGQTVTSDQTGSNKLRFPAATGASTGVLMRFSSTGGGTTLPGTIPTPSAGTGATPGGSSTAPVSNYQDSGTAELRAQGTWGLFKFFDSGAPAKQPNGEYLLTYTLGGKKVQATVKPTGGDLFDKSIFRSVKAPDKMQN